LTARETFRAGSKDEYSDPHVIHGFACDHRLSYARDNSVIAG